MDKLPPDELNAALAERLFGLDVRSVVDRYASGHGNIDEVEKFIIWKGEGYEDVPDYLTWQGMGEVIEAMAKRGWGFELMSHKDGWCAEFSDLPSRGVLAGDGDTAPRTVALAALSALTQEVTS